MIERWPPERNLIDCLREAIVFYKGRRFFGVLIVVEYLMVSYSFQRLWILVLVFVYWPILD